MNLPFNRWFKCEINKENKTLKITPSPENNSTDEEDEEDDTGISSKFKSFHISQSKERKYMDETSEEFSAEICLKDQFCPESDEINFQELKKNTLPAQISHILTSKPYINGKYFKYRNIIYNRAYVVGRIEEISVLQSKNKWNVIILNDGTGKLKCLFDEKFNNKERRFKDAKAEEKLRKNAKTPQFDAINLLMAKIQQRRLVLPNFLNLSIGDNVAVFGKINYYNEEFSMFGSKLTCVTNKNDMDLTELQHNFYQDQIDSTNS